MHGVRGEAGVSDKEKDSESMQYATLENAQKCVDNAFRLYDDASKTSAPTKAALIELGIEELAKGLLISFKTPEIKKISLGGILKIDDILKGQSGGDFAASLRGHKISDFKTHNHEKKLNTIQFILDGAGAFYSIYKDNLAPLYDVLSKTYGGASTEPHGSDSKKIDEAFSSLSYMDVGKLYKIKEDGFYVDFERGESISPEERKFNSVGIIMVFFVLYSTLNLLIRMCSGGELIDIIMDQKAILGRFYDIIYGSKNTGSGGLV